MSAKASRRRSGNPAVAAQQRAAAQHQARARDAAPTPSRTPSPRPPARASHPHPLRRLTDTWATERIPVGVDYPHALRTTTASIFTSALGVTLGLLSFMVVTPLVVQGLAALYWLAAGSPGDFATTYRALVAYELPLGLAVGHLGLATLIPLSFALVLFVHRVKAGIVSSVAGRLRWRWLGACLPVAFGSLAVVVVAQNLTAPAGPSWQLSPQDGWYWFVLVMLVSTPLQAAAEEYFFRGYLVQAFGSMVRTPWFGILASAAVFTLFHGTLDPALVADRFAFGVLAGVLVVRTGGIEAGIAAHVANNVTSFLLASLTTSMAEVRAIAEVTWLAAGWDVVRFALFTGLALLLARRLSVGRLTGA